MVTVDIGSRLGFSAILEKRHWHFHNSSLSFLNTAVVSLSERAVIEWILRVEINFVLLS